MQRKMSELSSKHKIVLSSGTRKVEAPLPPDFGFTVGSEYTTPFDVGNISGNIQKLYAVLGISNPVGLRMRKLYANPEPSEISFDMEFAAYYSAKEEVVLPIVTLLMMSLGHVTTNADIEAYIKRFANLAAKGIALTGEAAETVELLSGGAADAINSGATYTEGAVDTATDVATETLNDGTVSAVTGSILDLINLISAPEPCILRFGDFITLPKVFVTSTAVQFSNVLDKDGYPMSGTVSVTCVPQLAILADDIGPMFGSIVGA